MTFRIHQMIALAACFLAAASARGAVITWNAATNISGDANVLNSYTTVGAFNLGAAGVSSTAVNGVTFAPFAITGASNTVGNFTVAYTGSFYATNTAFGSSATPFSSLSGPYQTLLQSGTATPNGDITLTMAGLTPGQVYYFEWWSNDSGPRFPIYSTTATNGNTVALNDNTSGIVAGGLGSWATGTFTADSSPEVITYSGSSLTPLFNAFELQTVPEPATVSLLVFAGVSMLMQRKRRAMR